MAFDGIALYAVIQELKSTVSGARINKIHQPKQDELIISLRSSKGEIRLLISTNPSNCRFHNTQFASNNPMSPPMFCMLLRKHLIGGRIHQILQHGLERIVEISIHSSDEFLRPVEYKLIVEIMGKHSNIILTDERSGLIIDSIKRVSSQISRFREILPGLPYTPPPLESKISLLANDLGDIYASLNSAVAQESQKTISKWLLDNIMGISGNTSYEICRRADIGSKRMVSSLHSLEIQDIIKVLEELSRHLRDKSFEPSLYRGLKAHEVIDFWVLPMASLERHREHYPTVNDAVDSFFQRKDNALAINSSAHDIAKQLNKQLKKLQQNLFYYEQKLTRTSERDKYRLWGEILSAHLYKIEPGLREVTLPNFYDGNKDLVIPLKAHLSPSKNAQRYFSLYKKLQSTEVIVKKRREDYLREVDYLENVLVSLNHCEALDEVDEIRRELEAQGYLKASKKRTAYVHKSEPLAFRTSDGFNVFVGKNNRQNDLLTFKRAKSEDVWLHAKDIPGSHVVIASRGAEVTEKALQEAGALAAYFSKAQNSSNVPVDYTLIKYVKKPFGGKPGFVHYTHQKTLYITPDKSLLEKLSL